MCYELVSDLHQQGHSVTRSCQTLEVSQSGYYSHLKSKEKHCNPLKKKRKDKVIEIFHENKGRYGRVRIKKEFDKSGESISEATISKIMKQNNLVARKKKPFRPQTTKQSGATKFKPNLMAKLSQKELTSKSLRVTVADITYIPTREGWLYLAGVMDLQTKYIKGYETSDSLHTELPLSALKKHLAHYDKSDRLIHHTDRGCQYTSKAYQEELQQWGAESSMSGKGYCYDNAAMESFWSTLKTEFLPDSGIFETRSDADRAIFEYIESYYNTQRMHSSIGYQTPLEAEQNAA
jgi:transposase InsO family protein